MAVYRENGKSWSDKKKEKPIAWKRTGRGGREEKTKTNNRK